MTAMVKTETVKKVIEDKKHVLDKDFAKDLAVMLLEGKAEVVSYSRSLGTNEVIYDGWRVVDYGGTVAEEAEILLPKGIKLTITREGCR
jgi:hypothetical protein